MRCLQNADPAASVLALRHRALNELAQQQF